MKQIIVGILFIIILAGCKSKAAMAEAKAGKELSTKKIIEGHYDTKKDFSTLYIRANTKYKDEKQSFTFTSDIKVKKDEIILISIRFLGMTMAKGIITPTEVKYYEKSGNKYLEGDYSTLSKWLGTDLDFTKVQNMLIGQAMDDLRLGKYRNTIEDKLYKLEDKNGESTQKSFFFEGANFMIKKQEIGQPYQNRKLQVFYPAHKEYRESVLPLRIMIEALQNNGRTTIGLEYNHVTFNEDFSFPYSVPNGYERIYVD